jgi:hypothetical protein
MRPFPRTAKLATFNLPGAVCKVGSQNCFSGRFL